MKQYFVTGTNTDVGKTVVASLLCYHLKLNYFKPIQTGSMEIVDKNTVEELARVKIYENSYCLKIPASPAFAAEKEGIDIDLKNIVLPNDNLIVEGAGGCLVPINKGETMVDLMKQLNIPVIVVAKNKLGVVSSALTTIESIKNRGIKIAGVILNGDEDPFNNAKAIEHYGNVEVLDKISEIKSLTFEGIKNYKLSKRVMLL